MTAAAKATGAVRGAGRSRTPGAPAQSAEVQLPALAPVTVARLEETGRLLEALFDENVSLFIRKGQDFKERHREATSRQLFADEAAQIAAALAESDAENVTVEERIGVAAEVQASQLRAFDEPDRNDILLAAGLATAPALMEAVRKVVALVELSAEAFEKASIDGMLRAAIEEHAARLRNIEVTEARARAAAALTHYANAAGYDVGEAWRLPVQAVWQALTQAVRHLDTGSQPSRLIRSAASTEGSPATTSSTGSPGEMPSS